MTEVCCERCGRLGCNVGEEVGVANLLASGSSSSEEWSEWVGDGGVGGWAGGCTSVYSEYMASKKLSLKSWLASQPCLCIYKFTFFIQFCRALIAASRRGRPLLLEYSKFLGAPLPCLEDLSLSSE